MPDAALKLVQACGRLIRHERDYGTVTMLDKRIVTQRYGRALIESLPPFRLDIARSVKSLRYEQTYFSAVAVVSNSPVVGMSANLPLL